MYEFILFFRKPTSQPCPSLNQATASLAHQQYIFETSRQTCCKFSTNECQMKCQKNVHQHGECFYSNVVTNCDKYKHSQVHSVQSFEENVPAITGAMEGSYICRKSVSLFDDCFFEDKVR